MILEDSFDTFDGEDRFKFFLQLVDIIGPLYQLDDGSRKRNILDAIKHIWSANKIPFFFCNQGMGKSFILKPYLEKALGAAVFEPKDYRLYSLQVAPQNVIFLARVHDKRYQDQESINLIESVQTDTRGLFSPEQFQKGRLELVVTQSDVDRMALALVDGDPHKLGIHYKLGRKGVVSAFQRWDLPVTHGINSLRNLLDC